MSANVRGTELLERVGLTDAADRKVGGYSGGMKRRLDLGLALVHRPRLLFLDEPTTGLDPQSRAALWDEVRRLADDGVTVFLTTQYLEEADVLADRVGIIDRGTIVAEGTPAALKAEIGRSSVEVVPQDPGDRERLKEVLHRFGEEGAAAPNSVAAQLPEGVSDLAEIVRTLDAENLPIADLRLHTPTLDDVFLAKTGRSLEGAGMSRTNRATGRRCRKARAPARARDRCAGCDRSWGTSLKRPLDDGRAGPPMSSLLSTQVSVLARRSMRKTLRQPFQLFPIVFFPIILLAVNASGLKSATLLAGFPTHSYVSFAIAVAFLQGAMFALINTGTNLAEDIESGFFNRLALTPLRRVALIAGLLVGVAAVGALQSAVYIADRSDRGRPSGRRLRRRARGDRAGLADDGGVRRARLRGRAVDGVRRSGAGPVSAVLRVHLPVLRQPAAQPARERLVSHGRRLEPDLLSDRGVPQPVHLRLGRDRAVARLRGRGGPRADRAGRGELGFEDKDAAHMILSPHGGAGSASYRSKIGQHTCSTPRFLRPGWAGLDSSANPGWAA